MVTIRQYRKCLRRAPVYSVFLALLCSSLVAADANRVNVSAENIAASGYDLVSYFTAHPERGSEDFVSLYGGATYLFSSQAHVEEFESQPERFLPAFGGFCAFGVSMGKRLSVDPLVYEIVDERLYLLLNRVTKKTWQHDQENNIKKAERLWRAL